MTIKGDFDSSKPWERLSHRKREDGMIDLFDERGKLLVSFVPPSGGCTAEEFLRFLHYAARVSTTEKHGLS